MKRIALIVAGLALLLPAAPARGQDEHPISVGLFPPAQIVPEDESVRGVRLSLIYGKNVDVSGLDLGLANHTTRNFLGAQFGAVGISDGDVEGWQSNWVNVTRGQMQGLQDGVVSITETGRGVQFSGYNQAQNFRGLQLGIVNYAGYLSGIQIGLINIIRDNGQFPVFPIVNWGKGEG
jgi:hypothetical protein